MNPHTRGLHEALNRALSMLVRAGGIVLAEHKRWLDAEADIQPEVQETQQPNLSEHPAAEKEAA